MTDDIRSTWTDSISAQSSEQPAHTSQHSPQPAQAAAPSVPMKQIVTIRLDVDTLAWFKSAGPGYQTRINQLLREHMEAQQALSRNAA
jgi:uncharacterized protein (DUF4415 family)